jgi:hypothetical protein
MSNAADTSAEAVEALASWHDNEAGAWASDGGNIALGRIHRKHAATLRALLAEREALREAQAWKPIETAPKDGTPLLLAGWWNEDPDSGIRWRAVGAWHVEAGEWIEDCEEAGDTSLIPPTHWMLAPATPHEDETP